MGSSRRGSDIGRLEDLPAIAQMAERGARFVLWRWQTRNGKATKVPIRVNGQLADSTRAVTWATLAECEAVAPDLPDIAGKGFVLAAERDEAAGKLAIVGVDLDGCRDPETGAIEPWAAETIADFASYTETSPSDTGVKVYAFVNPVPKLAANKLVIHPGNGSGKAAQIEVFTTARYFCLTGQHLEGTPDEITDATEAFERLAARIAKGSGPRSRKGTAAAHVDGAEPSSGTMELIERNPRLAQLWAGSKDHGDDTGSGLDWSLALELGRAGVPAEEIGRTLCHYPHGKVGRLKGKEAERHLGQLLKAAEEARQQAKDDRTDVRLEIGRWNGMLRQCAGLLHNVVYMRGTVPVILARAAEAGGRTVEDKDGSAVDLHGVRHRPGSLLFIGASSSRVAWHLDGRARFWRWVRRDREWVSALCPKDDVAASIVENSIYLGLRSCAGIVHTPLLVDGRVVARPGYHEPTGLILDLASPPPDLPQVLDKAAAEKALKRLLRPFRGFLKGRCADRTAVATAVLTAVLRASLPTAPAILIDGNNPAVGKGKLARTLSALTTGGLPAVVTEGHSDEETEKRIASAVLQGAPVILLDNLQRKLSSSTLESMLTEPVADIRTFGKLENLRVACRALLLLTANNATLRKDMLRRTLSVRIVVQEEKPELRSFDFDPVAEAARDRALLVAAAFTVVLAWLRVRDLPENKQHRKPLGSFEEWADLVAGAVSWLTGKSPVDLIEEHKDQDQGSADERQIIAALEAKFGEKEWSAKQATEMVSADVWAGAVRFKGDCPTAVDVGNWLRKLKDRVFTVKRKDSNTVTVTLKNTLDRNGVGVWFLRGVQGVEGGSFSSRAKFGENDDEGEKEGSEEETAKSDRATGNTPSNQPHPPHPDEPEGFDL
jgi:hypothetical protein